ncbi:transglutaminase domain-containing protein [Formosa sp. PL04]|uniref:transglutaminase domain-containing protein n=1 Tax=Formosa sp. PL04 TaxID=3081755 RepID=UPI0029827E4B|nr:transglutaminase domain-containing protein [Formosa sp. PL04]MDW5290732.1 transglutaminase domain-containing protein [Formosa sp. PL04]
MLLKKLRWTLKRHPFLYTSRFRLLSQNSNANAISELSYNDWNTKADIPDYFNKINSKIFSEGKPNSELEFAIQLSVWLCAHTKVGPGLSESSAKALETMLYGSGGVCSDMAQIFNNFCVINDVKVREWGTTSAPFNTGNGGHSFNEVYVTKLKKWVFIDPSWGMLLYNAQDEPVSVLELFELARSGATVKNYCFIDGKTIDEAPLMKNYLNTDITPFLICNYHNKTYDYYLERGRPHIPVFIIHFMVYVTGKSYHYKFPIDDYKNIFL